MRKRLDAIWPGRRPCRFAWSSAYSDWNVRWCGCTSLIDYPGAVYGVSWN